MVAKRIHCPKGHLIAGENEVARRGGHRCRICTNAYYRAYGKRTAHKHSNAYKQRRRETAHGNG